MSNFTPGDVSGLQALIAADHLYEVHINELRESRDVSAVVGRSANSEYYCDGIADDVQIQQALDDVNAAGGGIVFLKAGTYNIASIVNIPSNIELIGEGEGTKVIIPTAVYFFGLNVSNIKIRDFQVDCSGQGGLGSEEQAIFFRNAQNVEVSGMHIKAYGFGLFFGCLNLVGFPPQVGAQDTSKIWIHHNYITGTCRQDIIGGGNNFDTEDFVYKHILIEHNFLSHDANGGGTTNFNAIDNTPCKQLQFSNNIVEGNLYFGNERDPHEYSSITNNIVRPPANSTNKMCGIVIQDENNTGDISGKCLVSGNVIYGGHIRVQGRSDGKIKYVNVVGNTIINDPARTVNDQTGKLSQNAIRIEQAANCLVSGNHCYGPSVTVSGICLVGTDNCAVIGNYVDGYSDSLVESGTVTNSFWANNYLINSSVAPATAITKNAPNNYGLNPNKLFAQGNVTGATTFNRINGDVITATLTGNITVTLTAGVIVGDKLTLKLTQDGTGSRTVTWPGTFKKVGGTLTLSTGAGAVDVIELVWDGTNWNEVARSLNLS